MFSNPVKDRKDYMKALAQENLHRSHILYLADQVNLASFHKRPQSEVEDLLSQLKQATLRKES